MTMPTAGRPLSLVLGLSLTILAGCAGTNRNIKQWSRSATSGAIEEFEDQIPQARSLLDSLGPGPKLADLVRLVTDNILQALASFLAGHPIDEALIHLRDSLLAGLDLTPLEQKLKRLLAELPQTLLESGRAFGTGFGENAGRPFGRGFAHEVAALTRDPEVRKAAAALGHEVGREVALGLAEGIEQSLDRLARPSPEVDARLHDVSRQVTLGVLDGARADAILHQPGTPGAERGERPAAYYLGRETVRGTLDAGSGQLQWLQWVTILAGAGLVLVLLAGNLYLIVLLRRQTRGAPPAA